MVALNPEVLRMVQASSLGSRLGRERMIFNLQTAVERYLAGEQLRNLVDPKLGY